MRLAVLGGSTPFTVPLLDEVAARLPGPGELMLHGRDRGALDAVGSYALARLGPRGWRIRTTTSWARALDGPNVVLHQVRYGDLRGRAADEELATALGVPADETLGPAALRSALRAAPQVRALAGELRRRCPAALVLNLTNPLSLTTALLAAAGLRVWGLCELPLVTHRQAAALLGLPPARLDWAYTGLNHRGFLHALRVDGRSVLDRLVGALPDRAAGALGILGSEVRAVGALPLKYFGLFAGHAPHGAGRAEQLARLRSAATAQLHAAPSVRPASLAGRPTPWYADAVGPVLSAVAGIAVADTVVTVPAADGFGRECRARIDGTGLRALPVPDPPPAVRPWLDRFDRHERAVLAAVADPRRDALLAACEADPLLPGDRVEEAVRRLSPPASRR